MAGVKRWSADIFMYIVGSFLFALSVNTFSAPNNIISGGFTGIGIMANFLFGIPIGTLTFLLNLPLFIWGCIQRGKNFIIKTLAATFISSAVIDISASFLPAYDSDRMLASIFAGVLSGAGLGLIFRFDGTTGGSDLAASLISYKIKKISIGKLILFFDCIIIALSAPVYHNIEAPMYAAVVVFISTKLIDAILYGKSEKMLLIISPEYSAISDALMFQAHRGVTLLNAEGGFTGHKTMAVLCAVERYEVYKAYSLIQKTDPNAFVVTLDTAEISGNGFGKS